MDLQIVKRTVKDAKPSAADTWKATFLTIGVSLSNMGYNMVNGCDTENYQCLGIGLAQIVVGIGLVALAIKS